MRAVLTALRGGLARRRVQAWAIGLIMLATVAASTLAAGLVAATDTPFDHAFTAQHGADVAVVVNTRKELAATARPVGVTAVAGPFAEATVTGVQGATELPPLTLVGRSSPGGPVDDIALSSGHWPTGTGQIVVSTTRSALRLGQVIAVTGSPHGVRLTVVGVGTSATKTADGWVLPAQLSALGVHLTEQMLYRFADAGSAAAVNADIAAVRRALPAGSLTGAESWLTIRAQDAQAAGPWVPFLATFGVIGLVMSVLIVVNVVSGAVVAGTRRIGVLKSVGFTPAQVVSIYVLQVTVPGAAGVVPGVVNGHSATLDPSGLSPQFYDVGLRPGVSTQDYANTVVGKLGLNYGSITPGNAYVNPLNGLIALLTLLLAAVAGLGVLNTVVLMTLERVRDIGVFKSVGMTPRQTITMVVTTVAATGLIAGLIAVPAGVAMHHAVLPVMGDGADTALPPAVYNVYDTPELVLLALAGLLIAVGGALAPAGRATGTPAALALHAE
jgi:cell division protein FtsX